LLVSGIVGANSSKRLLLVLLPRCVHSPILTTTPASHDAGAPFSGLLVESMIFDDEEQLLAPGCPVEIFALDPNWPNWSEVELQLFATSWIFPPLHRGGSVSVLLRNTTNADVVCTVALHELVAAPAGVH